MDITILSIKDQFLSAYQYASEKAGELAGHTVKAINQGVVIFNTGLGYVREDVRLAALTFAVVNIIIFELALGISILFLMIRMSHHRQLKAICCWVFFHLSS